MWESKPLYFWWYLHIWSRPPPIKYLFCLLISVTIYERNTDGIYQTLAGESSQRCTSLVIHLKADHCKNQNCSFCQECGILHGYTQKNVHLSSWCPYRTLEINISGFQDSVHKHKLHFTFCKNRGEKNTIFHETTKRNQESMLPEEKT